MDAATRDLVRRRADDRCEYCRTPQAVVPFISFHIEHIVARQHLDDDSADNLALACDRCNAYKGTNIATLDAESRERIDLFHPRRDSWGDHFRIDGATIIGLTPAGRATVRLLHINDDRRVNLREAWLLEGGAL